jgi:hypothetical protein
MRGRGCRLSAAVALSCVLTAWFEHDTAAAPIQSNGYTIIDLGTGQSGITNTGSSSIVISAEGGTAFPFPWTGRYPTQDPQDFSWTQTLPVPNPAPVGDPMTWGNPSFAYSVIQGVSVHSNGVAVAVNAWGVVGHQYSNAVYVAQHNADGTWSNPVGLWSGPGGNLGAPNGTAPRVQDFNNAGLFLGTTGDTSKQDGSQTVLFNLNNHVLTNFQFLSTLSATGSAIPSSFSSSFFLNPQPISLDDVGRILMSVQESDGTHDLLLVPDGVSADPVAVPEPGAWLVFSMALGAVALRCRSCRAA